MAKFISIFTHPPRTTGPTPDEIARMGKLIEEAMAEGWLIATEGVSFAEAGAIVRSRGGKISVTDGPFAEAKEVIGGYALVRAGSREEAIALCKRFLTVAGDGTCELHQLYEQCANGAPR